MKLGINHNKRTTIVVLLFAVFVFFFLRLPQVLKNEFPFVFDMGRDHIWVRNMVELKKPTLLGPWGSLAGVYMGPGWYYFLATPYIISGGDPRASVIAVMLANLTALLAGTWLLRKAVSTNAAIIFAFLYAVSPHNINITTYPFHANMLPFTVMFMVLSMYQILQGKKQWWAVAALMTSLNFHFEPAAGIFTTLTLGIFALWHRKLLSLKSLSLSLISFLLLFTPHAIFESRHQFLQTKAVISYFGGHNESLEGKLPFFERIIERLRKFSELFSASVLPHATPIMAGITVLGVTAWLWQSKKTKKETNLLCLISLSLSVPLLGFMFLFPPELKGWYMYGWSVCYFMLVALFLNKLSFRPLILNSLFIILFLLWASQFQNRLLGRQPKFEGPELVKTQISTLEKIYDLSQGKPFSLYIYTPPIYDYQYQYMVWWLDKTKGLPEPVEYSYQPGEISYHPEKQNFTHKSGQSPEMTFLLMEQESSPERLQGWLGHFASLPKIAEMQLASGVTLQIRAPQKK